MQKGGIPSKLGCRKHTRMVTQLLREARENRGSLEILWLDLAYTYGLMPYKLVAEALERHHVQASVRDLILDYYRAMEVGSSGTSQLLSKGSWGRSIPVGAQPGAQDHCGDHLLHYHHLREV